MILRLVLELVVVVVAAQAHRRQHHDLPIVQAWPAHVPTRLFIDVLGHQLHDFPPKFTARIDVLKARQNGYHLVTTIVIEHQFTNGCTIKAALIIVVLSHPNTPRRFAAEVAFFHHKFNARTPKRVQSSSSFFSKITDFFRTKPISGQTLAKGGQRPVLLLGQPIPHRVVA
jgi:hypothetical protein